MRYTYHQQRHLLASKLSLQSMMNSGDLSCKESKRTATTAADIVLSAKHVSPPKHTTKQRHKVEARRAQDTTPRAEKKAEDLSSFIELRQLPGTLPRSESQALENEVLTSNVLQRAGLPVPSVARLTRDKNTNRVTRALISKSDGVPLASVSWPLLDPRWQHAQRQIDTAFSSLNRQRSLTFGPTARVVSGRGHKTWPQAFLAMFEALLQDGEDQFVNLPYKEIRRLVKEQKPTLPIVFDAQLVIPNFGSRRSVLVDEDSGDIAEYIGFRDAYWGDPDLFNRDANNVLYSCYQAAKVIIVNHFRPGTAPGPEVIEARSTIMNSIST